MNYEGGISLKELIEILEKQDQDIVLSIGLGCPHSYRGYYECLAFEPEKDVKVADMVKMVKKQMGVVHTGWKGGEYRMGLYTECYFAWHGDTGVALTKEVVHSFFVIAEKYLVR